MALYEVTIKGTAEIVRVYQIEADSHQEAGDKAWNKFEDFPNEYTVYPNDDEWVDRARLL